MTNLKTKEREIYGNWQVESPEGILMFRCDTKKANWYLDRDLAERISQQVVRLKFKPRGLGNHNRGYGLTEMRNLCVSCGSEEYLTRHHVVPISYRKHFPMELKSHNFHDVLSMCVGCHEEYERKADQLKSYFAKKYSAPINGILSKRREVKVIKYANTILRNDALIPQSRIDEMSQEIKNYLGRDWTTEDLEELSSTPKQVVLKTHGEIVMSQVNDLREFIQTWRKHFIDNNQLNFLPSNWRIENYIIIDEHK